jgi:fused signal recognition particle receptor
MVVVLLIVALVIVIGASLAVVAARRRGDATLLEPPDPNKGVPQAVKDDVARHVADLETELDDDAPESAGPTTPTEVDDALAAAVEDALAPAAPDAVTEPEVTEPEVTEPEAPPEAPVPVKPRLRDRLGKARGLLSGYVGSILSRGKIDDETWDELEEALIRADVGITPTSELLDGLRARVKAEGITEAPDLLEALKAELKTRLSGFDRELHYAEAAPSVWLFVGVNGVGKTTSIGKLAQREIAEGHEVVLAAGDTFRAAASEQLEMWADRAGAGFVRGADGGDPSAVIFDAVESASAKGADLVLADTAGRLHTKVNLMEELRKVRRVAEKGAGTVSEVLLVIDATTGQNGLVQAEQFTEAVEVTGVVLTKLDGSAKGGIAVAIAYELGLPVKLVGVGEGLDDLRPFDANDFAHALVAA